METFRRLTGLWQPESAKVEEQEPEPLDAKSMDLLVDLGGRFLRSSLHLESKRFEDLRMLRMEFVLDRDEQQMRAFVAECTQEAVLDKLKVKFSCLCHCYRRVCDSNTKTLLRNRR